MKAEARANRATVEKIKRELKTCGIRHKNHWHVNYENRKLLLVFRLTLLGCPIFIDLIVIA
jgi:Uri superfamily endonuclease